MHQKAFLGASEDGGVQRKCKWDGVTLKELEERINHYIVWYNTKRRKRSLKGVSPMEFRQSLGLALTA